VPSGSPSCFSIMRSSRFTPPNNHNHAYQMEYRDDRCWCKECGQSWKMLTRQDGSLNGWFPMPAVEMEFGESRWSESRW